MRVSAIAGAGRGGPQAAHPVVRVCVPVHRVPIQRQAADGHDAAPDQDHQAAARDDPGPLPGLHQGRHANHGRRGLPERYSQLLRDLPQVGACPQNGAGRRVLAARLQRGLQEQHRKTRQASTNLNHFSKYLWNCIEKKQDY